MPFNFLLFPLLAGYAFIHTFRGTRFRAYGLEGYRLLIESIFAGLILLLPVQLVLFGDLRFAWGQQIGAGFESLVVISNLRIAVFLLTFGIALPAILNSLLKLTNRDARVGRYVLRKYGDAQTRFPVNAADRSQLVLLTMEDRKVYVGWIIKGFNLDRRSRFIRLLPVLSGYRKQDTQEVVLTTKYMGIYLSLLGRADHRLDGFEFKDFQVVLPAEQIKSVRLFDLAVYESYFQGQTEGADAEQNGEAAQGAPAA